MKILIVDDEPSIRKLLIMMLQDDFEVKAVDSVESALNELRSQHWDLLITDYKMPGKSGVDLVNTLVDEQSHIPVIVITGQGSRDSIVETVQGRVAQVLAKPFDIVQLHSVIHSVVSA